jgi:hypothetical protein
MRNNHHLRLLKKFISVAMEFMNATPYQMLHAAKMAASPRVLLCPAWNNDPGGNLASPPPS